MSDFDLLMARLDEYENSLNDLWTSYNPDDPDLKIEIIGLKMSNLFYKYLVDIFELINNGLVDSVLAKLRGSLTAFTYILTGSTIFINPKITPAAVLGSLYLMFQNKRDNQKMTKPLKDEQVDILFDRIDYLESEYVDKTDAIFDRTLVYEDEEALEKLEEPEKSKRIVGGKLMESIKGNGKLDIDDKYNDILREIIQTSLNTNDNNIKKLVKKADKEYNKLVKDAVKHNKKDAKIERINRRLLH